MRAGLAWLLASIRSAFDRRITPAEHWALKQALAHPGRYYGDGGTIHGTNHVDVCLDRNGYVVQVWFRCQMLPFSVGYDTDREYHNPEIRLTGVEVID